MINDRKLKGRDIKRKVLDLLKAEDFGEALELLCKLPARRTINPLFILFCSTDSETRWRAITAAGVVVANLAEKDMESARVIMRRMIWNLNDESGGIGWGMPEAMGEAMARHEGLASEYVSILVSYAREDGNFLELESLQSGVLWGLGRLAQDRPDLLQDLVPHLRQHLSSKNPSLRGLAVWVIGLLGAEQTYNSLAPLMEDEEELSLYVNGMQRICRVSDLAREAMARGDEAIPNAS
jgi:HEAT repeat protein